MSTIVLDHQARLRSRAVPYLLRGQRGAGDQSAGVYLTGMTVTTDHVQLLDVEIVGIKKPRCGDKLYNHLQGVNKTRVYIFVRVYEDGNTIVAQAAPTRLIVVCGEEVVDPAFVVRTTKWMERERRQFRQFFLSIVAIAVVLAALAFVVFSCAVPVVSRSTSDPERVSLPAALNRMSPAERPHQDWATGFFIDSIRTDVDFSGKTDVSDAVALINYIFGGVDAPKRPRADTVRVATWSARNDSAAGEVWRAGHVDSLTYLFQDGNWKILYQVYEEGVLIDSFAIVGNTVWTFRYYAPALESLLGRNER